MRALTTPLAILSFVALSPAQEPLAPIPVLIVSGQNNHDWEWTSESLKEILTDSGRFEVTLTTEPAKTLADAKAIAKFRAFVLDYNGARWGEPAEAAFLAAVAGGAGVTVVHAANNSFDGWVEYEKLVGDLWREGTGHGRFHPFDVEIVDREHPLTARMPAMHAHPDELYHRLVHMHDVERRVLASALSSKESGGTGRQEPMIIVKSYGEGRVFHTPLGHVWRNVPQTRASYADPQFRWLIARGTEWAATGAVTLPPTPPNYLTKEERDAGFRLLFDGETTDGWRGFKRPEFPDRGWRVQDGALERVRGAGGGDIITREQFGDFELRFEWKVARRANSGVIYRVGEDDDETYESGPEYQVFDDRDRGPSIHSAASLYGLAAPSGGSLLPVGAFNTGRIVVHDGRIEHWLNGARVVECSMQDDGWRKLVADSKFKDMPNFGKLARGHIALQDHGNRVWYRSIRIREF